MDEYNVDYKTMFENIAKRLDDLLKKDEEYFALVKLMNEQKPYIEKVAKHSLNFKKNEQIKLMKILSSYGSLCKILCEKYSLIVEDEDVDNDCMD